MKNILAFAVLAIGVSVCSAGYPNFLCPVEKNGTIFFPCDKDCVYQHGASTGRCGNMDEEDYNCYCEKATTFHEEGYHCIKDTWNYRQLCVVDCQCNHGAKTGVCDVEKRACQCVGRDKKNTACQMRNVVEFADFTARMVPKDSTAWYYLKNYVQPDQIYN